MTANETATIAAVEPRAIARGRHSRRTANQSRPTPGEILVRSTNAQAAGNRKPTTIATVSSRWMLPPAISIAPMSRPRAKNRGPHRYQTAPMRIAVHTAMKTCHGRAVSGETSWRNAGE